MQCTAPPARRSSRPRTAGLAGMEIITARSCVADGEQQQQHRGRRRRKPSDGHVVAQLLDSPLPTPRRSCCGSAAGTPRSARAASPQRTHVPFSWESSPGVPKAGGAALERGWLPPRPPPGRFGGGGGGRAYHGGNATTDATSSDDDDDNDTFSDALDRISSSDRLAALSARLSSIDGRAASRRLSSFIMDRFLPAANAIARTSTEKRTKKPPRRAARRSEHDDEEDEAPDANPRLEMQSPRRERRVPALQQEEERWNGVTPPQQGSWRHEEEARGGGETPPRACGFAVVFPWCVKPVMCGFPWSPARPRASPPRRSSTMGDVLVKELGLRNGDPSHWHEGKIGGSGKEWSSPGGPGLGMSILGTSRRYCADARKAMSRLARSATDASSGCGGGSPRMSRERRSGKAATSPLHSTSGRMPQLQLKAPSESWLHHARGSNAVNSKR